MKKTSLSVILHIAVFVFLVPFLGIICMLEFYDFKLNNRLDYNEWTAELGSRLETDIASSFHQKFLFVNLNGAIRNLLGQREMNHVIKLNNGKLIQTLPRLDDNVISNNAAQVARLRDYLAAKGKPLLYVACPYTESVYDPQLPAGIVNYANDNHTRFLEMLAAQGIDTIDIRAAFHEDGIDHYDMMYQTDHHWNTDAGLYAYNQIAAYLHEKTGCVTDARIGNADQYEIHVWPQHHLGMYGQRTGRFFGGIDDFKLYLPKFPTLVHRVGEEQEAGSLDVVFYDTAPLESKDYSSRYTYDAVLGGLPVSGNRYINHLAENDMHILVLSDSFYKAVCPFLISAYKDVQYAHYTEVPDVTTVANMELNNYDAVIIMYEPTIIGFGTSFGFLG